MRFGFNQKDNPTPASIERACKIVSIVGVALTTWLQTVDFMPDKYIKVASSLIGLAVILSNALAPFFGHEITTDTVPAAEVTGIEEKQEKPQ